MGFQEHIYLCTKGHIQFGSSQLNEKRLISQQVESILNDNLSVPFFIGTFLLPLKTHKSQNPQQQFSFRRKDKGHLITNLFGLYSIDNWVHHGGNKNVETG